MRGGPTKWTAYVGIGSNSDPEDNLRRCMELLRERVIVRAVSAVYETEACGETAGGAGYLNAAIAVETVLHPAEFDRDVLKEIEARLGRARGNRQEVAIDLDLLAYSGSPTATIRWVCGPQSLDQAHVAVPLADVAPNLQHPVTGRRLHAIAKPLRGNTDIKPRPDVTLL